MITYLAKLSALKETSLRNIENLERLRSDSKMDQSTATSLINAEKGLITLIEILKERISKK